MSDLDALPHGIIGLKAPIEESSSSLLYILMALLVLALGCALFWFYRRKRKKKGSRLHDIRIQLEALPLDRPAEGSSFANTHPGTDNISVESFSSVFSSLLKEGLFLRFGIDIRSLGAKDIAQVVQVKKIEATSLAMPGEKTGEASLPFVSRDLEHVFSRIEQDLYAGLSLSVAERARFRDLAKEWLGEDGP